MESKDLAQINVTMIIGLLVLVSIEGIGFSTNNEISNKLEIEFILLETKISGIDVVIDHCDNMIKEDQRNIDHTITKQMCSINHIEKM